MKRLVTLPCEHKATHRINTVSAAHRRPVIEYVGIDVHKNQSQICLITEAGKVLHQRSHTQRERFVAVSAERPHPD